MPLALAGISPWQPSHEPFVFIEIQLKNIGSYTKFLDLNSPTFRTPILITLLKNLKWHVQAQRSRIIDSMTHVDNLNKTLRKQAAIRRREYQSARLNALWHVDGHHKLILWGIVIHGIVDGYCRTVVAMKPSTNNQSTNVLQLFVDAVKEYDSPPEFVVTEVERI